MAKTTLTIAEAEALEGRRATWELNAIIKALSICSLLNTPEENQRLEACKLVRRARRSSARLRSTRKVKR